MEKVNLYKFTHTPLLKNDGQLIQKSDKQPKKKKAITNLLKNKNHVPKKKSRLVKPKKINKNKNKTIIKPTAQNKKRGNMPTLYPTQPNTIKKVFLSIFSSKYSIHPISPPNKHTLSVSN